MIFCAKAPLRIGLAGGGTDVSPYADKYGGAIVNATISLYASASLTPRDDNKIVLDSRDLNKRIEVEVTERLEINGQLDLMKGVYNRLVKDFGLKPQGFNLITDVDAPKGSGLGTSSTLTVAVLGAFLEWLKLPLGKYDVARLAYEIERIDLEMSGGRQDQYAATFGGFNYMEIYANERVVVNQLQLQTRYQRKLEHNLLLYFTGTSRLSAKIIDQQKRAFAKTGTTNASIGAANALKRQAKLMKEAMLTGKVHVVGKLLNEGWQSKKMMADGISNAVIDQLYDSAISAGATGGKISGAGGGGFMIFYCPGQTRQAVSASLKAHGGEIHNFVFVNEGMVSWVG